MKEGFDASIASGLALPFRGWDFSPIQDRWRFDPRPWDFAEILRLRLQASSAFLDLGTGGGEFLASLAPLPERTYASEGYEPNLEPARTRLAPLGVQVLPIGRDQRIPLPDGSVDLVSSRHEGFSPAEIRRVLVPEGSFVTEQVGSRNFHELRERLGVGAPRTMNDVSSSDALAGEIARAGLAILDRREAFIRAEFLDVGAIAFYLRAAPWEAAGVPVEHLRDRLKAVHEEIRRDGSFRVTAHRLLVVARREA